MNGLRSPRAPRSCALAVVLAVLSTGVRPTCVRAEDGPPPPERPGLDVPSAPPAAPGTSAAPPPAFVVRLADGRPAAGAAVVEATPYGPSGVVVDETGPALAYADAAGGFATRPRPSAPGAPIFLRRDGAALTALPAEGDGLRLAPAAPLSGTIVRADAGALPDLEVVAFPMDAARAERAADVVVRRAPVGGGGAFRFGSLAAGTRWRVDARRRDGAWATIGEADAGTALAPFTLPPGATLRGRVFDVDGSRPVAGVTLRLRALDPAVAGAVARWGTAVAAVDGSDGTRATTTSDADGRFVVADLPPGLYEAAIDDPTRLWDGDAPRVEVRRLAAIRLEPWWALRRGAIRGRILDARTRAPIPQATVTAVPAPDAPLVAGGLARPTPVFSDADGRFRVDGLAPARGWRLLAHAPGRSPVVAGPIDVAGGRDENGGDVRLFLAWTLEVRVVDPAGRPVVGADVLATPSTRPIAADDTPGGDAFARRGATDAEGLVVLEGLAEGDHELHLSGPGLVPLARVVAGGDPGRRRTERVEMARTMAVVGRLTTTDGPLPAVGVRAIVREGGLVRTAVPDATGAFRLEDLPPAPMDVEAFVGSMVFARREGFVPGGRDALVLPIPLPRKVEGVADGLERTGPTAVVRLETLRYDVLRDVYAPALVAERPLERGVDHAPFAFPVVAQGVYALRLVQGLRDSGPIALTVDRVDWAGVEVRLPRGAVVEGLVLDARRNAAAFGAVVRLVRLTGEGDAPGVAVPVRAADEDGKFRFEGVAPGLWRAEVADRDAVGSSVEVRVAEGEDVFLRDLVLSAGGRIEGRLADDAFRPIAGVPIRVLHLPELAEQPPIVPREDGSFRSPPLPAGRYRLLLAAGLSSRPGLEADVEVADGETTTVDFTPGARGRIDGTVRRRGNPIAGVGIEAVLEATRGCDAIAYKVLTDAYGQFHWDGLSEGRYALRLIDGAVRSAVPVRLGRGDRVSRDLELGEGEIVGIVRQAGGDPIAGAEVVAVPIGGVELDLDAAASGRVRTRPDGRFEMFGLPVARYRLHVTPPNRPTKTVASVIAEPAGQGRDVEVWLGLGGRLELSVRDDRGRPVMAAEVWVENAQGVALHPRPYYTQPSGRLVIEGLAEGAGRVRVHARGYGRPLPSPVPLRDGATTGLDVMLRPACHLDVTVVAGRDPVPRARVEIRRLPSGELVLPRKALRRPEDTTGWGTTTRAGVLAVDDLEEGDYRIDVAAGSVWAPASVPVHVGPDGRNAATITLVPR